VSAVALRAVLACAALVLSGCAQPLLHADHPLAGRVWDSGASTFVTAEAAWERAAGARHVLIGEIHDNPEHHRLQRVALEAIASLGPRRTLAMEQFDSEHQPALDAARASGEDVERVADAGRFDREGWGWHLYRPLVAFAVERDWPLAAANLSRRELREFVADPSRLATLPPLAPELRQVLEQEMVDGHCGHRPDAKSLATWVDGQRARDARMAEVLERAGGPTVLLAGNSHVRRGRGVPQFLASRDEAILIGIVEVREAELAPQAYAQASTAHESYDYVFFTGRAPREDPCVRFRARLAPAPAPAGR